MKSLQTTMLIGRRAYPCSRSCAGSMVLRYHCTQISRKGQDPEHSVRYQRLVLGNRPGSPLRVLEPQELPPAMTTFAPPAATPLAVHWRRFEAECQQRSRSRKALVVACPAVGRGQLPERAGHLKLRPVQSAVRERLQMFQRRGNVGEISSSDQLQAHVLDEEAQEVSVQPQQQLIRLAKRALGRRAPGLRVLVQRSACKEPFVPHVFVPPAEHTHPETNQATKDQVTHRTFQCCAYYETAERSCHCQEVAETNRGDGEVSWAKAQYDDHGRQRHRQGEQHRWYRRDAQGEAKDPHRNAIDHATGRDEHAMGHQREDHTDVQDQDCRLPRPRCDTREKKP